jgi:hypothetical protein
MADFLAEKRDRHHIISVRILQQLLLMSSDMALNIQTATHKELTS